MDPLKQDATHGNMRVTAEKEYSQIQYESQKFSTSYQSQGFQGDKSSNFAE